MYPRHTGSPCFAEQSRLYTFMLLTLVTLLPAGLASAQDEKARNNAQNTNEEQQLLKLINQERSKQELQPLVLNDKLNKAARDWSVYMAEHDHFDHLGPDGTTPRQRAKQAGYPDISGWENIYYGEGSFGTAARTFAAWMNSPGHKANMLNEDLNEVGLGVATNSSGAKYWTLLGGIGKNVKAPENREPAND